MNTYEFIQSATDGGHPVPNGEHGFEHGTPLFVVSKRELFEFAQGMLDIIAAYPTTATTRATLEQLAMMMEGKKIATDLLKQNMFVEPIRKLGAPKSE